jgi:hypothetical protein
MTATTPAHREAIQRVLANRAARVHPTTVTRLDPSEADALLGACDKDTPPPAATMRCSPWRSRPGCASARSSGSPSVTSKPVSARTSTASAREGHKERRTPLLPATITVMNEWITEHIAPPMPHCSPPALDVVSALTRSSTASTTPSPRLHRAAVAGRKACDHVHAEAQRAMLLLHVGVYTTVIAIWLGHEQIAATNIYLQADMTLMGEVISKVTPHLASQLRGATSPPALSWPSSRRCNYPHLHPVHRLEPGSCTHAYHCNQPDHKLRRTHLVEDDHRRHQRERAYHQEVLSVSTLAAGKVNHDDYEHHHRCNSGSIRAPTWLANDPSISIVAMAKLGWYEFQGEVPPARVQA